uniref:Uncharacterized protein n=1 Tax=Knipowitschia caucasica TaxID=637954 RepID=A0AAV2LQI2_KNICA
MVVFLSWETKIRIKVRGQTSHSLKENAKNQKKSEEESPLSSEAITHPAYDYNVAAIYRTASWEEDRGMEMDGRSGRRDECPSLTADRKT